MHWSPGVSTTCPTSQLTQVSRETEPAFVLVVPAGQVMQDPLRAGKGLYLPVGQSTHSPFTSTLPARLRVTPRHKGHTGSQAANQPWGPIRPSPAPSSTHEDRTC